MIATHVEFNALLLRVNVTQAHFAQICGVTAKSVNNWCRGRQAPPKWALALALALRRVPQASLEEMPPLSWWETLGLHPWDATPDAIKQARAKLARRYHPDMGGNVAAMQRINAAFSAGMREAEARRHAA